MLAWAPLIADVEDWIKVVPVVVMILIYVFNRAMGKDAAQRPRPFPKVRQPEAPQPRPVPVERQRVEDEVAEFLRRAAQQRTAAAQGERSGQQGRLVEPERPRPAPVRRVEATPAAEPIEVEIIEDRRLVSGVDPLAEKDIGGRKLGDRHVGSVDVQVADEAMAAHLHQAFDHKLGQLAGQTKLQTAEVTPALPSSRLAAPGPMGALLAQLRNPANVAGAILVAEVLRRPEDRW